MYTKEETASPKVSMDALVLSLLIDIWEQHDMAMADVVGAYLNAEMLDFVLLWLTGDTINIMYHVNPCYSQYVVLEHGIKVLYLQLLRRLCMDAYSLLCCGMSYFLALCREWVSH